MNTQRTVTADDAREALAKALFRTEHDKTSYDWIDSVWSSVANRDQYRATATAILADPRIEVHPRGTDWRVLGGVIPGPIPVEWVQVGDTIQDHGVTGTITRATRSGGVVHLVIGSGHVSFAKVAQQDFITVLRSNHVDGSAR